MLLGSKGQHGIYKYEEILVILINTFIYVCKLSNKYQLDLHFKVVAQLNKYHDMSKYQYVIYDNCT